MKKFGFGKKSEDSFDDGGSRAALFSRKKESPAPSSDNPYAQQPPASDPYAQDTNKFANMTPYQQARSGLPSGPRGGGIPGGPSPRNGNAYGAPPAPRVSEQTYGGVNGQANGQANVGFGANKYGAAGGYGSNRYDDNNGAYGANKYNSGAVGARGPGGYGGLGRTNSTDTDDNRNALFSGAQERQKQTQQLPPQDGGYGSSGSGGNAYGGYGEQRELTDAEREEQSVDDIKREIKKVNMDSLDTTQRSLALINQSIETGSATLARLGAQGERLHNTDRHLDLAANHNVVAETRTKELKTLNRSMFAVHVGNPFTSSKRTAEREERTLNQHRSEREQRLATRQDTYSHNQELENTFKGLSNQPRATGSARASAAEQSKYGFEDSDSDADNPAGGPSNKRLNRDIDANIELMIDGVSRMKGLAVAQGDEVGRQNILIDRIGKKSDAVDDAVRLNRERLNRIK